MSRTDTQQAAVTLLDLWSDLGLDAPDGSALCRPAEQPFVDSLVLVLNNHLARAGVPATPTLVLRARELAGLAVCVIRLGSALPDVPLVS